MPLVWFGVYDNFTDTATETPDSSPLSFKMDTSFPEYTEKIEQIKAEIVMEILTKLTTPCDFKVMCQTTFLLKQLMKRYSRLERRITPPYFQQVTLRLSPPPPNSFLNGRKTF